ncbi:SagB/ThcOx family dehydrogenase [Helicobacter vulpis]|uniref:SagB/ThcOx family dehydrogenase n=1 Tax=Helicobacter vulpis TaxID=2316076 RepID=UPI0013CDE22B|nr:SagB/ThcOx family dehydrogenase [Helicobacter vulpis]
MHDKEPDSALKCFDNPLTDFFHQANQDLLLAISNLSKKEFAQVYLDKQASEPLPPLPPLLSMQDFTPDTIFHLPSPELGQLDTVSFLHVLRSRHAVREFTPHSTSLQDLSSLLFCVFGGFHRTEDEQECAPFFRRTSASAGALQCVQAYIVAFSVQDLEAGVYYYDGLNHVLCKQGIAPSHTELAKMLSGQFFAENCSFGIFLVVDVQRFFMEIHHCEEL